MGILSIIEGPLGRIIGYVIGAASLIGVYFIWENSVEQKALNEWNQKQLRQTINDQKVFIDKMNELADLQKRAVINLEETTQKIDQKYENVEKFLDSTETQKTDRPASDLLKETVRKLREGK